MAVVGDVVLYRLSDDDILPYHQEWSGEDPEYLATVMERPTLTQQYMAFVLYAREDGTCDLRVLLDGRNAEIWLRRVPEGTTGGTWAVRTEAA